ncbi:MAG: permease-like cell division protein FtsX [Actinobacteria bacterium]|nr:permease-like cell division protein FtsX [Actinomycetota bacterium]MCG2819826.1 permease-like cell division protein FtsX [Actinomycetes bacterium]MBU4217784.1 permease-like cell division protein FtsX [Actinomycetota bacterium]MBU4358015.1 permease-like cell division protein FtsX [Actinomycetota bacterium]MBU4391835.1 permease-like cell division protein FtsX [Actinomycetota bacterium]
MAVNFKYFLKESGSSMRRNMALTVAAVMVTSLSLIILGVVSMFVHTGNGLAADMKERVDEIRVFLDENVTVEERESLERHIRNMEEVRSVTYISKDEALEEFKKMYEDQQGMLDEIEGNPFPAEFKVQMKDPKYNNTVANRLESRPEVSTDENGKKEIKNPRDVVDKVLRWTGAIQKAGIVVVIAFGLVAVALVSITIRMAIYSRRKEIGIMKLVGATNWFIRWPFIFEGVVEGFLGAIVGIIFVLLINAWIISRVESAAENVNLVGGSYLALLSVFLICIGIFIGAVGSALALRRHIEV